MNFIKEFLAEMGITLPFLLAGSMGAVTSLVYEKQLSFKRALLLILVGAVSSAYLSPLVAVQLGLSDTVSNMSAFITGLLSMRIIGALLEIGDKLKNNPAKIIKRNGND